MHTYAYSHTLQQGTQRAPCSIHGFCNDHSRHCWQHHTPCQVLPCRLSRSQRLPQHTQWMSPTLALMLLGCCVQLQQGRTKHTLPPRAAAHKQRKPCKQSGCRPVLNSNKSAAGTASDAPLVPSCPCHRPHGQLAVPYPQGPHGMNNLRRMSCCTRSRGA